MITFADYCAKIEKEETETELQFELANDAHNNMTAFHCCMDRAIAYSAPGNRRLLRFKAYTFVLNALNKKEKHKLTEAEVMKLEEEKTELVADMADNPEDVLAAETGISTYGWWKP